MRNTNHCNRNNCSCTENGTIRVRNAFVEEIRNDNQAAFVTISYGVPGDFNMTSMKIVVLVVNNRTSIKNQRGQNIPFRNLRVGMRIDAEFEARMTASIPPQAQAIRIIINHTSSNSVVSEGRIIEIDVRNNFIVTGNRNNESSIVRYNITNETIILDRRGRAIRLRDLRIGWLVRIEHANFQTASIPPQTTAFRVQVL